MPQISLATCRQEVARRATEFIQGSATSNTNLTTITDVNALNYVDAYWAEAWVLMTSGTNNDQLRRTSTFIGSTQTLTLYQGLTASPATNDTYDLYRRFNPFTDIKNAINRAINIGAPDFREKHRDTVTATFNTLQYQFPTLLMDKGLVAIEYQWFVMSTQTDWPYQPLSTDLYSIIESWDSVNNNVKKVLQLKFNPETNKLIRFVYDMPLGNVNSSNDNIHLELPELEWLYTQSVAELWRIESMRTSAATRQAALESAAKADVEADKLRRQLAPETAPKALRRSTFRTIPGRVSGWWAVGIAFIGVAQMMLGNMNAV